MNVNLINNRYKIIEKLGEGGMGEVFLVADKLLADKELALKTIKQELINDQYLNSFKKEFDVMTRLKHPNLARVYDFGYDGETQNYFITMDYVPGASLKELLTNGWEWSAEIKVQIMVSVLRTLEFIHSRNILHRDIKPSNVMLMNNEQLRMKNENSQISTSDNPTFLSSYDFKIMDFGLSDLDVGKDAKTKGTLFYMAPEVLKGKIDRRVDIFAAGVTFYELLTGDVLYGTHKTGSIIGALKNQTTFSESSSLALQDIPNENLRTIIGKMIKFDRDERYGSCAEIIMDINAMLNENYALETEETREAYVLGANFVDRIDELNALKENLDAKSAFRHLYLIKGETGVGKSRLLAELKKYCQLNRIHFLAGNCTAQAAKVYNPFLDILNEALFHASGELIETYGGELKKILPYHDRLFDIEANPTLDPQSERGVLVQNITNFLMDYTQAQAKSVIYISDLHWADEASLDVINELLYKLSQFDDHNLRLYGTLRSEALERIGSLLQHLNQQERLKEISLNPFEMKDVEEYFYAIFGKEQIDETLSNAIPHIIERITTTPLNLQETVKSLVSKSIISREERLKWALTRSLDQIDFDIAPKAIIKTRISRLKLNPNQKICLQILSILRDSVTVEFFQKVVSEKYDVDAGQLLEYLESKELLITEIIEGNVEYGFPQIMIREAILEEIETPKPLYEFVAQRLEECYADEIDVHLDELAHDYYRTDNREKAKHYLENAGDKANVEYANRKAIDYYDKLLELLVESEWALSVKFSIKKGSVLERIGNWDEAKALYEKTLAISQEKADKFLIGKSLERLGGIYWRKGDYDQAEDFIEQAADIFTELDHKEELLNTITNRGNIYLRQGKNDLALEAFQKIIEIAEEIGSEGSIFSALNNMAVIWTYRGEYEKAKIELEGVLEKKTTDKRQMAFIYGNLGNIYYNQKKNDQALEYYRKSLEIAREFGEKNLMALSEGNIGVIYRRRKEYDKAMETYRDVYRIAKELGNKNLMALVWGNFASCYYFKGDYSKSLEYYEKRLKMGMETGNLHHTSGAYLGIGNVQAEQGKFDEAVGNYEKAISDYEKMGNTSELIQAYHSLAVAQMEMENYGDAEESFEQTIELARELDLKSALGDFYVAKAMLCYRMENYDEAETLIEKANEMPEQENGFDIRVLTAKILFYRDEERETAIQLLNELFADAEEKEQTANLHYELFKMTQDREHWAKAIKLYKTLYEKMPAYKYEQRLEELQLSRIINNRYQIIEKLGEGGMGEVYLVEDKLLANKQLALKTIRKEIMSDRLLKSFKREFEVMTRLKHPNLARVYDFGVDRAGQNYFITMDYLQGFSLKELLNPEAEVNFEEKLDIMVSFLRTLEFIHSRNVLHRDIKPENIMIMNNEGLRMKNKNNSSFIIDHSSLKLMDFGLADLEMSESQTKGTLFYMAPEILRSDNPIDERVDIFSAGVTFYELIAGNVLYRNHQQSKSIVSALKNRNIFHQNTEIALKEIENDGLRSIIGKMIDFNPENRYRCCAEIIADINDKLGKSYPLETKETREAYVLGTGFVDRTVELEQLIGKIGSRHEQEQLLLIIGEMGIGKSRLFQEFKKYCQLHDIQFIVGNCRERLAITYAPFLDILSRLLLNASQQLIQKYGAELKKVLPSFSRFRNIVANPAQSPKIERKMLIENISNVLLDYDAEQNSPIAIYLSDLQWADEASLDLLETLLQKLSQSQYENSGLRIYGSAREQLSDSVQMQLDKLGDKGHLKKIELTPFNPKDIRDYIEAIFGERRLDESLTDSVEELRETVGGNPLSLQETVKFLVESEMIAREENLQWRLTQPVETIDFHDTLTVTLNNRIANLGLGTAETECLQMLSLLHDGISIETFDRIISERHAIDVKAFFEQLETKEILIPTQIEGKIEYNFAQNLIREVVQQQIEHPKELHLFIAQRLEKLYADEVDQYWEELAYNYSRTDAKEKAVEYLEKVGDKAKREFANQKAIDYYDECLSILEDIPNQIKVLLKKKEILDNIGKWDHALEVTNRALKLSEEISDQKLIGESKLALSRLRHEKGDYQAALNLSEEAMEIFTELDDKKGISGAVNYIGTSYWYMGDYDKAMEYYKQFLSLSEELGNKRGVSAAAGNIGLIYHNQRKFDQAMEYYRKRLAIDKELGNKSGLSWTIHNIGLVHAEKGNFDQALEEYEKSLKIAKEVGSHRTLSMILGNIGRVLEFRGEFSQALEYYKKRLAIAEESGDKMFISIAKENMGILYRDMGENEKAEQCFDDAIKLGKETQLKYYLVSFLTSKAGFCYELGRYEEAKELIDEAIAIAEEIKRQDALFKAKILNAKTQFHLTDDDTEKNNQVETLKTMVSEVDDESMQATLQYDIFQLSGENEYATRALELNEKLYRNVPNIKYKRKIQKLREFIAENAINNRYFMLKKLGEGGMGDVFLVQDLLRGKRRIALKILKKEMIDDDAVLTSFQTEFDVMTRLKHPNLARVYDFGHVESDNIYYLTMDYVDGDSLAHLIRKADAIDLEQSLQMMVAICRTLDFIHTRNILHRDVKPENIMIINNEELRMNRGKNKNNSSLFIDQYSLKLMDFGIADLESSSKPKTKGTLVYMAPEVLQGIVDRRSDIFSAGITFYELLTGEILYKETDAKSVVTELKNKEGFDYNTAIALRKIGDSALRAIIKKMIAYQPENRYQSFSEIIFDINQKLDKSYPLETEKTKEAYVLGAGFVGREAELAVLKDKLNQPETSHELLLVSGESGVGKGRLFSEFRKYCQLHTIKFLEADCIDGVQKTYRILAEILDEILLSASKSIMEEYGAEIKKILPDHPKLSHIHVAPTSSNPKTERGILIEAMTNFIIAVASEQATPVVIYINDIQWIDNASLMGIQELLYKLSQHQGNLFLFASMKSEWRENIDSALSELERKERLQELRLSPFENSEIERYIVNIFGKGNINDSIKSAIPDLVRVSKGNPFYLTEILKCLINNGIIYRDESGWRLSKPIYEVELDTDMLTIAGRDLEKLNLTESQYHILRIFALYGKPVTISELNNLIPKIDKAQIFSLIELLEKAEVLFEHKEENKIIYRFSQTAYQTVMEQDIPEEKKKEIHHAIADRLCEIYNDELDQHYEKIAYHYSQTDDEENKILFWEKAADKARSEFANQKAIGYYDKLLSVLTDDAKRIEIFLKKSIVLDLIGKWDESFKINKHALALAEKLGEDRWIAETKFRFGISLKNKSKLKEAIKYFEDALELLAQLEDQENICKVLGYLGIIHLRLGGHEKARKLFQKKLEIAEERDDKKAISQAYTCLGDVNAFQGDSNLVLEYYRKQLAIAEELGDKYGIGSAIGKIGAVHAERRDVEKAIACYDRQIQIAKETGDKLSISVAVGNLGNAYFYQGDKEKALECYRKKLEFSEELGDKRRIGIAVMNMGVVYFEQGDPEKAVECFQRRLAIAEEIGDKRGIMVTVGNIGSFYHKLEEYEKAQECYDRAIRLAKELGLKYYLIGYLFSKAETNFVQKKYDPAEAFNRKTQKLAEETDRDEYIFRTRVLAARIIFEREDKFQDKAMAIGQLKELWEAETDTEHLAKLNYHLYEFTKQESYRKRALELYKMLNEKNSKYEYQDIINELEKEKKEEVVTVEEIKSGIQNLRKKIVSLKKQVEKNESTELGSAACYPKRNEILFDFIHTLNSAHYLDEVLEAIATEMRRIFLAGAALTLLFDDEKGSISKRVYRGNEEAVIRYELDYVNRLSEAVKERKTPIISTDLEKEESLSAEFSPEDLRNVYIISVPILSRTRQDVLGVIFLEKDSEEEKIKNFDLDLLMELARESTISIENAFFYERNRREKRDLARLYEIGKAITSVLILDELLNLIVDAVIEITDSERGFLMLKNEEGDLEFRIARDDKKKPLSEEDFDISFSIPYEVVQTGEPILLADVKETSFSRRNSIMRLNLQSILCVPLKKGKKLFGVLYVDNSIAKSKFTDYELNLLSTLASEASIAIENAKLYQDLQEKNQELMRLDSMKSDFINLASHELRTPLSIIKIYLDLLKSKLASGLSEKNMQIFENINRGINKLVSKFTEIADLSRLDSTDYQWKKENCNLNELISDVDAYVSSFMKQRNLTLTVELPSPPLEVFVNDDAVWQALMNIVLNAIRFTPDGGEIGIKARSVGNYAEVQVSDTGIGIPKGELKNIFKRFYVVGDIMHHTSGTIEFKSEGMGVGLSIAKAAVELNDGKIWVESVLDKGSTFYFTLPKDIRVGK